MAHKPSLAARQDPLLGHIHCPRIYHNTALASRRHKLSQSSSHSTLEFRSHQFHWSKPSKLANSQNSSNRLLPFMLLWSDPWPYQSPCYIIINPIDWIVERGVFIITRGGAVYPWDRCVPKVMLSEMLVKIIGPVAMITSSQASKLRRLKPSLTESLTDRGEM